MVLFSISACEKNSNIESNNEIKYRIDYLKVSDFDNYGKFHNELLTQASIKYPNGLNPSDSVQFVNTISDFCKEIVLSETIQQNFDFTDGFSALLFTAFEKTKDQFLINNPNTFMDESNFEEEIKNLKDSGTISSFYQSILVRIFNDAKLNLNNDLSYEEFGVRIDNYINEFNNHQYPIDSNEGMVLAITLSLAANSIVWWTNPRNYNNQIQERIVPWLIADAIGAVLSGGAALISECAEDDDINWWGVAAWTVAGGAGMSIGVKL